MLNRLVIVLCFSCIIYLTFSFCTFFNFSDIISPLLISTLEAFNFIFISSFRGQNSRINLLNLMKTFFLSVCYWKKGQGNTNDEKFIFHDEHDKKKTYIANYIEVRNWFLITRSVLIRTILTRRSCIVSRDGIVLSWCCVHRRWSTRVVRWSTYRR